MLHWNVEPVSVEMKVNVAVLVVTVPLGPVRIVVFGGWSTSKAPESQDVPCGRSRSR